MSGRVRGQAMAVPLERFFDGHQSRSADTQPGTIQGRRLWRTECQLMPGHVIVVRVRDEPCAAGGDSNRWPDREQ